MLYLPGKVERNLYFREGEIESAENGRRKWDTPFRQDTELTQDDSDDTIQYANAMLEPIHGLSSGSGGLWPFKKPARNLRVEFSQLCDALFGELDNLEIYSWFKDCSTYFDAGEEWWGTAFWTVYSLSKKWIVTVLASSTD